MEGIRGLESIQRFVSSRVREFGVGEDRGLVEFEGWRRFKVCMTRWLEGIRGFMAVIVREFEGIRGSRVQFDGSIVRDFNSSMVREFDGSRVRWFDGSMVRRFVTLRVLR